MTRMSYSAAVIALASVVLIGGAPAWAANYSIDPQHSQIEFRVKHLGISTVTGKFADFDGKLFFDPDRIEAGKVEVAINAASIDTAVEKRDEHLRSGDFLSVSDFPEIRFESRSVEQLDDGLAITGDLTIRGVTRPVVLETEFNGRAVDPWGNARVGFEARAQISREDFGLTWNKVLETGGLLVSDEVNIVLVVQGIEQSTEPQPAS